MSNESSCTRITPRKSLLGAPPLMPRIKGVFQPLSRAFQNQHNKVMKISDKSETKKSKRSWNKKFFRKQKVRPSAKPTSNLIDFSSPVSQSLPFFPSSSSIPSSPESLQPIPADVQPHEEDLITFDYPDISDAFGDPISHLNQTTVMEPTRTSLN